LAADHAVQAFGMVRGESNISPDAVDGLSFVSGAGIVQLSENQPQELSLKDSLEVLRRRKWTILETFGLVVAAGAIATAIATPIFRAEA
jgi:hypothetical protein